MPPGIGPAELGYKMGTWIKQDVAGTQDRCLRTGRKGAATQDRDSPSDAMPAESGV